MAAAILGRINYYASATPGTVSLAPTEKLIGLWCVATGAGGYLTIDGGAQIPLVAGVPFAFALESRTEEWVGVDVVFSGTASYFVKSKLKV
jgi:hypothetical protein